MNAIFFQNYIFRITSYNSCHRNTCEFKISTRWSYIYKQFFSNIPTLTEHLVDSSFWWTICLNSWQHFGEHTEAIEILQNSSFKALGIVFYNIISIFFQVEKCGTKRFTKWDYIRIHPERVWVCLSMEHEIYVKLSISFILDLSLRMLVFMIFEVIICDWLHNCFCKYLRFSEISVHNISAALRYEILRNNIYMPL